MEAREVGSALAAFRGGVHCAALSCFAQAQGIHPWTPARRSEACFAERHRRAPVPGRPVAKTASSLGSREARWRL